MGKHTDAERRSVSPFHLLILSSVLVAGPFSAASQAADDVEESPEVVVTASRLGVGLPGTSTTVITAVEIERSAAATLPELLSQEVGVQQRNFYSASAADPVVDLRGFGATAANNTLVLVNGRRLNDFDLAAVDWGNIPLQSIERIEISRGNSGAVLYGDGAVGGVINIVTKTDAEDGTHGKATVKYGSYVHREANFSLTQKSGRFSVNAHGTGINSRNYRRNNDIIQRNLITEARYAGDDGDFYVNIGADDQTLGTPGARKVTLTSTQLSPEDVRREATVPNDFTVQSGISVTFGGTRQITDSVEAVLDLGYRIKDTEARTVSSFGPQYNSYIDTELATWSLTPRLNIDFEAFDRPSTGTVGVDYYYSDYNSDRQLDPDGAAYHRYDGKQHSVGLYAQTTVQATPATEISVGARGQYTRFIAGDIYNSSLLAFPGYDGHRESTDDGSQDWAANLGIDHQITNDFAVFGRIARSFRAPTVDERIGSDSSYKSFALKTQTSRDAEAGIRVKMGSVKIESSAFYMRLRDEIHYDPDSSTNKNFDPTRRMGLENAVTWQATKTVRIKANLTYTDAEFVDGPYKGNTVPLVSKYAAGVMANWAILGDLLEMTASVNCFGTKKMENDEKNFQPEIPGYTLVNLKLGGKYKSFLWSTSLNNVFDADYYDYAVASSTTYGTYNAYPLPGRTFLLEAGMEF